VSGLRLIECFMPVKVLVEIVVVFLVLVGRSYYLERKFNISVETQFPSFSLRVFCLHPM
jgi:hypothetical protein